MKKFLEDKKGHNARRGFDSNSGGRKSRKNKSNLRFTPGRAEPLGATVLEDGVQFALFSSRAKGVTLLLYNKASESKPSHEFPLNPKTNTTGDYWHIAIEGLSAGQLYLYRVEGDFKPKEGLRFDPTCPVLDPYAQALSGPVSNSPHVPFPKCVVVDNNFDWQGDRPLNYPLSECIIYEAHLRGLTKHASSARLGVEHPGSYRGVIEMIPYLKELGITSLELMPIQEFDETEYGYRKNPITGKPLRNYWGYSTIAFFAPKASYASSLGEEISEFKEMVRELHKAGIEVILDVVFNHTGENDVQGRTYSFRGIDNPAYYLLEADKSRYKNYSGCGNSTNCNHPAMRKLIIDALHYWVEEMHVDGFRFDLASILLRNEEGQIMPNNSVVHFISRDPVLQDTKIIAEAWDAAGTYQVGAFPGRWAEWNDRFRDDIKQFWRGDPIPLSILAQRLAGSSDLYSQRGVQYSINYITAHDGFTLNDLVSYNAKHNEANGEGNRDGSNHEFSYNFGVEGQSKKPEVEAIRSRMVKNFISTILLSRGTPMLLGGDEIRRSQRGNNNAYCQDNETTWFNFEHLEPYSELRQFVALLVNFRKKFLLWRAIKGIYWQNEEGGDPDWGSTAGRLSMQYSFASQNEQGSYRAWSVLVLFNAGLSECSFKLPETVLVHNEEGVASAEQHSVGKTSWQCYANSGDPKGYFAGEMPSFSAGDGYLLAERSLAVFVCGQPVGSDK